MSLISIVVFGAVFEFTLLNLIQGVILNGAVFQAEVKGSRVQCTAFKIAPLPDLLIV